LAIALGDTEAPVTGSSYLGYYKIPLFSFSEVWGEKKTNT